MDTAEQRVDRTLQEWEDARQEEDRIRSKYIVVRTGNPGEPLKWPTHKIDVGLSEILEAEAKAQEAWETHQQAISEWMKKRGH